MKVFIGLGNPAEKYQQTRHNVGFQVLDYLAERRGSVFRQAKRLHSALVKTDNLVLAKPQTYMNDSGRAVRAVLDFYQVSSQQLYVVHDDLDLKLGHHKLQFGKGPKIHNGLLSIYETLGTDRFWHVRFGVDSRKGDRSLAGSDYVLSKFRAEELELVQETVEKICDRLLG